MADLKIMCFGALLVEVDGQPVQRFDMDKSRALLVYLTVENGHTQARSHLAGLLWSDQSEEQALHSLYQKISSLRKTLGDNNSTSPFLLSERDTVLLNPAKLLRVDVQAFQSGLDAACRYYQQRRERSGWLNMRRLVAALAIRQRSFLENGVEPVVELLTQAPGLNLMVTSREWLKLAEEWTYLVAGLRYPANAAIENLDQCIPGQFDALDLFLLRAHQAQVGFSLDAAVLAAAIRICQLVEGLPLGIELAAGAVWDQPISVIAEQIANYINAFSAPAVNVQPRHRSLWAAFDVSWQLLSPAGQALFCQLGVFQGGFTQQAARQVAETSQEVLVALVSKSLVQCDTQGRYALHEAVRQYALEKLTDAGMQDETRAAHARFYAEWLATQGRRQHGEQQKQGFVEIQDEIGNAGLAWTWLVENQAYTLIDGRVDSLYQIFNLRSRFLEGIEWFQPAAACPEEQIACSLEPEPIYGKLLARIGSLAYYARQNALALDTLEHAHELFIRLNEPSELVFTQAALGGVYLRAKDFERALVYPRQNLVYYCTAGDALGQNRANYMLGLIENRLVRFLESKKYIQAAIDAGQRDDAILENLISQLIQ